MEAKGRYTYGDSDLAAERLDLVARMFEPPTRSLLKRAIAGRPQLALDLGCGPGHTTRLIQQTLEPVRTVGLEGSERFVQLASAAARRGVEFMCHDVRMTPFPVGPADVIFARLLVAHLSEAAAVVVAWVSQLAPGGSLLIIELEALEPGEAAVDDYIEQVAKPLVASQGGRLFSGPWLHEMADPAGTDRLIDEVATIIPLASVSAKICAMNVAVLTERGEIQPRPELLEALASIADGLNADAVPAVWSLRQIVLRRKG
jgi:trans-aconitate 2-methyltransferase